MVRNVHIQWPQGPGQSVGWRCYILGSENLHEVSLALPLEEGQSSFSLRALAIHCEIGQVILSDVLRTEDDCSTIYTPGVLHYPFPDFMTCQRLHGRNHHPGEYREAGPEDKNIIVTYMHGTETVIYICELIPMRDILVDLHIPLQIVCDRKELGPPTASHK
jgi:hypothetical protein